MLDSLLNIDILLPLIGATARAARTPAPAPTTPDPLALADDELAGALAERAEATERLSRNHSRIDELRGRLFPTVPDEADDEGEIVVYPNAEELAAAHSSLATLEAMLPGLEAAWRFAGRRVDRAQAARQRAYTDTVVPRVREAMAGVARALVALGEAAHNATRVRDEAVRGGAIGHEIPGMNLSAFDLRDRDSRANALLAEIARDYGIEVPNPIRDDAARENEAWHLEATRRMHAETGGIAAGPEQIVEFRPGRKARALWRKLWDGKPRHAHRDDELEVAR